MKRTLVLAALMASLPRPSSAESAEQARVIRADPRDTVAFVTLSPIGTEGVEAHRAIEELDELLRERTGLAARSAEQIGFDPSALRACDADRRFTCWVSEIEDANPKVRPRFLLMLAAQRIEARSERWTFFFIDLAWAKSTLRELDETPAEQAIFDRALLGEPAAVDPSDPRSRRNALRSMVVEKIEATLRASGSLRPFGEIQLAAVDEGLEISIDERVLGVADGRPLRIIDVRGGKRRITARGPRSYLGAVDVIVRPEQIAKAALPERPDRALPGLKKVGLWTGVATAAAGAALFTVALAQGSGGTRLGCFGAAGGAECPRVSSAAARSIDTTPRVNANVSGGLSPEVLGAGLSVAGATWIVGGLTADSELVFWLELGLGAALGAATSGVVYAATGG